MHQNRIVLHWSFTLLSDQYPLTNDAMYQSYVQIKNEEKSLEAGDTYWENYACAIKFNEADGGVVSRDNYWYSGTCGTGLLADIYDQPFTGVRAAKTCNPYYPDYETSSTSNSDGNAMVTCSFYRLFEYPEAGVQPYELEQTLVLRTGFNVFSTRQETSAEYSGRSD